MRAVAGPLLVTLALHTRGGRRQNGAPTPTPLTPPGTNVIKGVVSWRKPLVLRGEGRDKTRLLFPKSLTDL